MFDYIQQYRLISFMSIVLVICLAALFVSAQSQCPEGLRVRSNFLSLTSEERKAYASAFLALKESDFIDKMVTKHRRVPHGTSWFLPVHRAMLKEFEDELIKASNGVLKALPYWDELADSVNPRSSRIFSSDGVGALDSGNLGAPFVGLTDDTDHTMVKRNPPASISGLFGWAPASQLVASSIVRFSTFGQMAQNIEMIPHNRYHIIVGGHMGVVSQSPSDPLFWLHHSYTDMLWAVWQAAGPNNEENLEVQENQQRINRDDRVPLYTSYTALDMVRYRTRLCYTYEQSSPSSALRLKSGQTRTGANSRSLNSAQTNDPSNDPRTIKEFPRLIPLTDEQWKEWMPNISIENVREVEQTYLDLIDESNKLIKDGKLDPSDMKIVDDLVENVAGNTSLTDDGKDTGIQAVAMLAHNQ